MDILYGRNSVLEALRAGRPARRLVLAAGVREERRLSEIVALATERGIAVDEISRRRLDDIAHTEHHQGIAGYFHARPALQLDDLLGALTPLPLLLVLDGIQDPQNLGALARTAEAVGVNALLLSRHRSVSATPAASKASAGALEHLRLCEVGNLVGALERLRGHGIWCVGLAAEATTRYDAVDYTVPTALVVGAEGEGLRPLTRRHCDTVVRLPMLGRVSSLNAAVAGALLMYEAARQRGFAVQGATPPLP